MPVVFSIEEQDPSWRASDYFVSNRTLTGVELESGKGPSEPSGICR